MTSQDDSQGKDVRNSITAAIGVLTIAFAAPAIAQDAGASTEDINARITEVFNPQLAAITAFECADNDTACLSAELVARYELDQWAREQFISGAMCADFSGQDAENCSGMVMGTIAFQVDMRNTARLKEIIAVHGWPQAPAFSEETQNAAWYLVQHAMALDGNGGLNWDAAFAESVIPQVREAVEAEQLTPWHYAAMFDRVELSRGRPQRYATQITCAQGRAYPRSLEDENRVDEFRAEIGMAAFDQAVYDESCAASGIPGEA